MTAIHMDSKFDPTENKENALESFNEFVANFKYLYLSLNREPPKDLQAGEKEEWISKDKKCVFLGRHASRAMQKELEAIKTETKITAMNFEEMVTAYQQRFGLQANQTLANYRFRKIAQRSEETFDAFVIRVRDDAKSCKFKCTAPNCDVASTLIRDQILIGTHDQDIRKQALHNEWTLEDLIDNGRSMEAANKGALKIKSEPSDIRRTAPGKYSKRKNLRKDKNSETTCTTCTNPKCRGGKKCFGLQVTCFACDKKGHYAGAKACKKKNNLKSSKRPTKKRGKKPRANKVEEDISASETSSEISDEDVDSSSSGASSSGDITDSSDIEANTKRLRSRIPRIRKIAGARKRQRIRRTVSKYMTEVVIKETPIIVHADTGADVCVISKKNAKKMNLERLPTRMRIRPYGSKSYRCDSVYIGTIMFGENVTTAEIYVVNKNVETLLSGPVCEDLGILTFTKGAQVNSIKVENKPIDSVKAKLMTEFPKVFSGRIGELKGHQVGFHIKKNVKPVVQPKRPIPFHLRGRLEKELKLMEKDDIIEEHHGPVSWLSNLVLAPKEDGGIRVTVDLRNANDAIKPTHIPIPRPEEVRSNLAGYKCFSKIDLRSAFHQLVLSPESREMTTFYANKRLMRYKRLTMGSTPASGELTKALNPILGDIEGVFVIHDDIIIGGEDQETHDKSLQEVCERLDKAGMTLNEHKCIISKESIPWWGMIISKDGISPDPEKVRDIKDLTPPKNKDEVKSFFCFVQSNKDFITSIASKTVNMRKLLKKHAHFKWTKECNEEFNNLKEELREDILMQHFDPSLNTYIYVDAHKTGLSAVLKQGNDEEKARPVVIASRATTDTETRYPN